MTGVKGRSGNPRWKKGVSGNPGGRPVISAEVLELARSRSVDAMRLLIRYIDDETAEWRARQAAANAILDRAWGKPVQRTKLEDDDGKAVQPIVRVILEQH